jgi:hypothetical protein
LGAAVALVVAASLRCGGGGGDDPDAGECRTNADCPGGTCVDGRCVTVAPDGGGDDGADPDAPVEADADADDAAPADGDGETGSDGEGGPDADGDDGAVDEGPDPLADGDGDTIPDAVEGTGDTDGDTLPNAADDDSDDDAIPDAFEAADTELRTPPPDSDRDGTPDFLDLDSDGDTLLDRVEGPGDPDGDGRPSYRDFDADEDGILDGEEAGDADPATPPRDADADTLPDFLDPDSDGDSLADLDETSADVDADTLPDYLDPDSDDDGVADVDEAGDADAATSPADCDGDGRADFRDTDSDNDGVRDGDEPGYGTGRCDPDSDGDGVSDLVEITYGSLPLDPADSPRTRGDFVFVVPYSADPLAPVPPDPLRDTLSFATDLQKVDVYVAIDSSASMGGEIANLRAGFRTVVVPGVAARVPDAWFGLGRFEDCSPTTCAHGMHNLVDLTSDTAAVDAALAGTWTTCGPREPYRQMLWLLATGNTTGFTTGVLPIPRRCTDPATVGWPCFRPDAVKVIIQAGDEPMAQSDATTCAPRKTDAETVAALNSGRFRFIGLESGGAVLRADMERMAIATGSVNAVTGLPLVFRVNTDGTGLSSTVVDAVEQLARNVPIRVDAVPEDDPADAVDAVAEFIDHLETNTSGATVMGRVCTVGLATDDSDGDGSPDYFPTVFPGTSVCWDIVPRSNLGVPATEDAQLFRATIRVIGDLFTPLDARRIYFLVPPVIPGSQ